jgi:hypothetical protein
LCSWATAPKGPRAGSEQTRASKHVGGNITAKYHGVERVSPEILWDEPERARVDQDTGEPSPCKTDPRCSILEGDIVNNLSPEAKARRTEASTKHLTDETTVKVLAVITKAEEVAFDKGYDDGYEDGLIAGGLALKPTTD